LLVILNAADQNRRDKDCPQDIVIPF
jgi:hypothetical protein